MNELNLERLAKGGWVESFAYNQNTGEVMVRWTERGRHRGGLLKELIKAYDLTGGPDHVLKFDAACLDPEKCDLSLKSAARFWRDCMRELGITRDNIDFSGIAFVVAKFAPDIEDAEEDDDEPEK